MMVIENSLKNQENQKIKNYLSLKKLLNLKNYQKIGIYLKLIIKILNQTF